MATLLHREPEAPEFVRVSLNQFNDYVYTGVAGTPYTDPTCYHRLMKTDMVFIGG